MAEHTTSTIASLTEEGEQIKGRMRRDLKEGDLVEIHLKDNARFVAGLFPVVILDNSGRNNKPNQSCVGHFDGIYDDLVSFKYTHNMEDYDRAGFDVLCYAIKDYVKIPMGQEKSEEPSAH